MKNINKHITLMLLAGLAITSCKKDLDLENPNAPTQVSIETPRAGIMNWQTGQIARYAAMLSQQSAVGADPNKSYDQLYSNYVVSNSDYKYIYENAYALILNPASVIADEEANLISGLTYVNLEQTFTNAYLLSEQGQEPLTEADIMNLLDPIISGGGEFAQPASLAKAKYYLNNGRYTEAIPLVQNFAPENSYTYASSGTVNNSTIWDQFRRNRQQYMQTDSFGRTQFNGADTLRYRQYFGHSSSEPFSQTVQIDANHVLNFENAYLTVDILGYIEAKLIEAECLVRTGGSADAALNAAMQAHFTRLGLDPANAPSYSGASLDDTKIEIFKTMWGHPQILFNMRRWQSEGYIPGFVEKVPGQFPGKHTYVVQ